MAYTNWSSSTVQSQHKVPHKLRRLSYQHTVHLLQFAALMVTAVASGVVRFHLSFQQSAIEQEKTTINTFLKLREPTFEARLAQLTSKVWSKRERLPWRRGQYIPLSHRYVPDGGSTFLCHTVTYLMTILISNISDGEEKDEKRFPTLHTVLCEPWGPQRP